MLPYAECAAACAYTVSLPSFFILSSIFFYGGYVLSSVRSKSIIRRLKGQLKTRVGTNELGRGQSIVTDILSVVNDAFRAERQREVNPNAKLISDMFESILSNVRDGGPDDSSSDDDEEECSTA